MVLGVKNPSIKARDIREVGLIPESGGSVGGGHGNPLQYSCLENLMDRGAWWPTVRGGRKESDRTEETNVPMHKHDLFFSLSVLNSLGQEVSKNLGRCS